MRPLLITATLLLAASLVLPAAADVVASDAAGFTVQTELNVAAPSQQVFKALTEDIGAWWHQDHTFGGDASKLFMEPRAGGIFGETLPDGGSVRHLDVLFYLPPTTLRLGGGLGPLQGMAVNGALTVDLSPMEDGTRLVMTYTVSGWVPNGLAALADPVDGVLAEQMERLKNHVEP